MHHYESLTGAGSIILDSGKVVPWADTALESGGLRHLRVGQRVHINVDRADTEDPQAVVTQVWIHGISATSRQP